jgi:hypothetical protein
MLMLVVLVGMVWVGYKVDAGPILGNMILALVAHQKAGEPIPFAPDYTLSMPYPSYATYGMTVNSLWLADRATNVVPYFEFDNLTAEAQYPVAAFFLPHAGISSYNWWAGSDGGGEPGNERALPDRSSMD